MCVCDPLTSYLYEMPSEELEKAMEEIEKWQLEKE